MKIFLDANIIIDFLDNTRSNHELSNRFFEWIIKGGHKLVISEDILTTVYYICQKKISRKKLLDFFMTLNDEFSIVGFGDQSINEAIRLCKKNKKLDFEDVLQAVCARNHGCDVVVTNDKSFPAIGNVKTVQEIIELNKRTL